MGVRQRGRAIGDPCHRAVAHDHLGDRAALDDRGALHACALSHAHRDVNWVHPAVLLEPAGVACHLDEAHLHQASGVPRGAGGELVALEQHRVGPARVGQVVETTTRARLGRAGSATGPRSIGAAVHSPPDSPPVHWRFIFGIVPIPAVATLWDMKFEFDQRKSRAWAAVVTMRVSKVRIISVRRARPAEEALYEGE